MHSYGSLQEGSLFPQDYFPVVDDGYDASKYGYRTFVPSAPKTRFLCRSSSSTRRIERFDECGYTDSARMDDYSQCMQVIDPRSLDILSSPEVRAIIESQRDWDDSKADYCISNRNMQHPDVDDGYLSDSETMKAGWTNCVSFTDSFEKIPSLDEKKL
jgi:hypothetical protein